LVGEHLARELSSGVTVVTLPPSALATLEGSGGVKVETVVSAGEACSDALAQRWAARCRLLNAYGPTEGTVCATIASCGIETPGSIIGKPISNVRVYVLDSGLALRPPGAIGELFIAGAGVARGYAGLPALTAERFLPDPFSDVPGARMYRTGDLVRWHHDGQLQFIRRSDTQVKIRGTRIELSEVESALSAHPALRECAVVIKNGRSAAEPRLVAYYVARHAGIVPAAAELRGHLRRLLPEAMVPSAFVALDALPQTHAGKLDRSALPEPPSPSLTAPVGFASNLERVVAEVWREVLGVDGVGTHDNFFDIGGTSLSAVRVHARLQERTNRELPLLDLFTYPTIRSLSAVLIARHTTSPPPAAHGSVLSSARLRRAAENARRTSSQIRRASKHTR
jgi:acyl carrier protein